MTEKKKTQPSMFEVGQEVIYRSGGRSSTDQRVTVTRVGTKFAYIRLPKWGEEMAFDKRTGLPSRGYGYRASEAPRIISPQIERRDAALARVKPLREHYGIAFDGLSTDQLERIADIVEEGR